MCICWCVTEVNHKMHGATIKTVLSVFTARYELNKYNSGYSLSSRSER